MIFPDPYQKVADEISAGDLDQALWVRSWAESGGHYDRATAIYVRLRVAEICQFNQEAARITERMIADTQKKQREYARVQARRAHADALGEARLRREQFWNEHGSTVIVVGLLAFFIFLIVVGSSGR